LTLEIVCVHIIAGHGVMLCTVADGHHYDVTVVWSGFGTESVVKNMCLGCGGIFRLAVFRRTVCVWCI